MGSLARYKVLVLAAAVLAAACSPAPGASMPPTTGTPSIVSDQGAEPTITPAASSANFSLLPWSGTTGINPNPIMDCSDAGGVIGASDPVALVLPHGKEYALRDYADPAHPRTVCRFSNPQIVQLIDARHIVVGETTAADAFSVVDLPEMHHHGFQLPEPLSMQARFLGISPELDAVAWRSFDLNQDGLGAIHITTSNGDRVVATLPGRTLGGGFGQLDIASFSPSGKYFFLFDRRSPPNGPNENPGARTLLVTDRSKVLFKLAPPLGGWRLGTEPQAPFWAPRSDKLYYWWNGQIRTWTPSSGERSFLPNAQWCFPTISPDGRYLAYAALGADGHFATNIVDLSRNPSSQTIGTGPRNAGGFLNAGQLWYRAWTGMQCTYGGNQGLVYETTDGSESASLIDRLYNTRPSTSAAYNGVYTSGAVDNPGFF